jgi:hypothetical protein
VVQRISVEGGKVVSGAQLVTGSLAVRSSDPKPKYYAVLRLRVSGLRRSMKMEKRTSDWARPDCDVPCDEQPKKNEPKKAPIESKPKNCHHPFGYSGTSAFTSCSVDSLLDPSQPGLPGLRKEP